MPPSAADERRATIIAVNDTYALTGVRKGARGGMHRLATLRRLVENETDAVLLLHGGDFLSPSLLSDYLHGEQMVSVMNALDRAPGAFDDRMVVTIGNHEFDQSNCTKNPELLRDRVTESEFTWVVSNLDFADCPGLSALPQIANMRRTVVREIGGIRIGIFGISMSGEGGAPKYPREADTIATAREMIEALRSEGTEVVIALTHRERTEDQALIDELTGSGLDFVVGGHDHEAMRLTGPQGRLRGVKADSDAVSAWRITIRMDEPQEGADGAPAEPEITAYKIVLDQSLEGDELIEDLAQEWRGRADAMICEEFDRNRPDASFGPDCLNQQIGRTRVAIDVDEKRSRSSETGIGDWVADQVRRETGADLAIVQAGMLRPSVSLAAGSDLSRRDIFQLVRFDAPPALKRDVSVDTVCRALRHGFEYTGRGAWPNVSQGVSVALPPADAAGRRDPRSIRITLPEGTDCDASDGEGSLTVAAPAYLLCGGDDYPFLAAGEDATACAEALDEEFGDGKGLRQILEDRIVAAGSEGIDPSADGRVTVRERPAD